MSPEPKRFFVFGFVEFLPKQIAEIDVQPVNKSAFMVQQDPFEIS